MNFVMRKVLFIEKINIDDVKQLYCTLPGTYISVVQTSMISLLVRCGQWTNRLKMVV